MVNNVEIERPEDPADPVVVNLMYPSTGDSSGSVYISLYHVRAVDSVEVVWNHDANQWEIYRDIVRIVTESRSGAIETVAERVMVCALPAWSEVGKRKTPGAMERLT